MSDLGIFVLIAVIAVFYYGEPDLHDALVSHFAGFPITCQEKNGGTGLECDAKPGPTK